MLNGEVRENCRAIATQTRALKYAHKCVCVCVCTGVGYGFEVGIQLVNAAHLAILLIKIV